MKKISPVLFAFIILCFFLPFINISCSGQKVLSLSGIQLVTGTSLEEEEPFSGKKSSEKIDSEPLAIVVFVAAIAGLAFSFIKSEKSALLPAITGGIGGGTLLFLKAKIDQEVLREGQGIIQVEYAIGFWLILFSLFAAVALNVFIFFNKKNMKKLTILNLILLVCIILLTNCGKRDPEKILSKMWKMAELNKGGRYEKVPSEWRMEFKIDGTYTTIDLSSGELKNGTWKLNFDKNQIILDNDTSIDDIWHILELNEDKFKLRIGVGWEFLELVLVPSEKIQLPKQPTATQPSLDIAKLRDQIEKQLQQLQTWSSPEYLLNPDSFAKAVTTVWLDFNAWITRTDLTENYKEFYEVGSQYHYLSVDALIKARRFLNDNKPLYAEKYLEKSNIYAKLSNDSFAAATEAFNDHLDAAKTLAEGIKNGSQTAVQFGLKFCCPAVAEAADWLYMAVDYGLDTVLEDSATANKNLLMKLIVNAMFEQIPFESLGGKTIKDYIETNPSKQLSSVLEQLTKEQEWQGALSKTIRGSGVQLSEGATEALLKYLSNISVSKEIQ
jgi:hypothetical protein